MCRKKHLKMQYILLAFCLLLGSLLAILWSGEKAYAYDYNNATITLTPGQSLRDAIASASDGDVIQLAGDEDGVFREVFTASTPIVIDKSIKITSANSAVDLCVYASASPSVGYGTAAAIFHIKAPDVTFENFAALRIGGKSGEAVGISVNIAAFLYADTAAARFTLRDIANISAMANSATNVSKKLLSVNGAADVRVQNCSLAYPSTTKEACGIFAQGAANLQILDSTIQIAAVSSFGIQFDGGDAHANLTLARTTLTAQSQKNITMLSAANVGILSMQDSALTLAYNTQTGLQLNAVRQLNIHGCHFQSTAASAVHIAGSEIADTRITNGSAFTITHSGRICDITNRAENTRFAMNDTEIHMNYKSSIGFTLNGVGSAAFTGNTIQNPSGCTLVKAVTLNACDSAVLTNNRVQLHSASSYAFEIFDTPGVELNTNDFALYAAGTVAASIDAKNAPVLAVKLQNNTIDTNLGSSSSPSRGIAIQAGSAETAVLESSGNRMTLRSVSRGITARDLTSAQFANENIHCNDAANGAKGIELTGGADAVFRDCAIIMDGTKSEGVALYGTDGITFTRCNVDIVGGITSSPAIGIAIRANETVLPKNLLIDGENKTHMRSYSTNNWGIGISIEAVDGAVIKGVAFDNCYQNTGEERKNFGTSPLRFIDNASNPAQVMIQNVTVSDCSFAISGIRGIGITASGKVLGTPPENGYSIQNMTVRGNIFQVRGKDGQNDNNNNSGNSYRGDSDRSIGLTVAKIDGFLLEENTVTVDGMFSKGCTFVSGIANQVLQNTLIGKNAGWMGLISGGTWTNAPGVSENREEKALIQKNRLQGSFHTGIYLASNSNQILENNFKDASFAGTQISVTICHGATILRNIFAPAADVAQPAIRLTEAQVAQTSDNTFHFASADADHVLAIGGNANPYVDNGIDEFSEAESGNTIGATPAIETERMRASDNSVQYAYILSPAKTTEPEPTPEPKEKGTLNLFLSKKLTDQNGTVTGSGSRVAVRLLDSEGNLLQRVILNANEEASVIHDLEGGSTYYLTEESGAFTLLGYEIRGTGMYSDAVLGFSVPKIADGETAELFIEVRNQELPEDETDNRPPSNPAPDLEEIPIVDVNLPENTAPDTGDSLHQMASLFALLFSAAAFLLLRQERKRS